VLKGQRGNALAIDIYTCMSDPCNHVRKISHIIVPIALLQPIRKFNLALGEFPIFRNHLLTDCVQV